MIRSLTGWRYVFAVVIFLHHYLIDGKSALQAGGVIGVTFFHTELVSTRLRL